MGLVKSLKEAGKAKKLKFNTVLIEAKSIALIDALNLHISDLYF